ncbi:MAG: hypothetical protein U0Q16_38535 [Bryobacteraceae bacterium]
MPVPAGSAGDPGGGNSDATSQICARQRMQAGSTGALVAASVRQARDWLRELGLVHGVQPKTA